MYRAVLRLSCREGVTGNVEGELEGVPGNVEGELERGCIGTVEGELEIAATVWVQLCALVWVCGWM